MGFLDETGLELLWANIMILINSKISTIEVPVTKVNGKTGEVILTAADIGATTESYVDNKVAAMVDSAPETLNTLNELAAALGDDPNFATTVSNQIGNKVDKTTTVNGKALSSNITLTASDVGALPSSTVIPSTAGLASQTYVNQAVAKKMDKNDPVGTGSFSLNRKTGTTVGTYSFTEGSNNTASGEHSHAEGYSTTASGNRSHAEGTSTKASGLLSHAEGAHTTASGERSHAEGNNSIASGEIAHAEGAQTQASGRHSHAEGFSTKASGDHSHAEGGNTEASGFYSHAEGDNTRAFGYRSHAEGESTITAGASSHAEGYNDKMSSGITITGEAGVTIYQYTGTPVVELTVGARLLCLSTNVSSKVTAIDTSNLTISVENTLSSSSALSNSEVKFYRANTNGYGSHSEGHNTMAHGDASHAEGEETQAYGSYSHAEGQNTYASGRSQHVQGRYNLISDGYAHIVGNGDSENRSNAMTLDWQGNARFDGDIYVQGTGTSNLTDAKKVATEEFVTSKGYLTSIPAEYITETELTAKDYATETYVNNATVAVKNDLLNGAGAAYDTLKELGDLIDDNTDALEALETTASNKMDKVDPTGTGSFSLNRKAGTSIGNRSFAEGENTEASATGSHAEGYLTQALGTYSHAEGDRTCASGSAAHAEGQKTHATFWSHAEGRQTYALGDNTHAEGHLATAATIGAHAEGYNTLAHKYAHAENYFTHALGDYSHAEGYNTIATGKAAHAEGAAYNGNYGNNLKLTGSAGTTTYTYSGVDSIDVGSIYGTNIGTKGQVIAVDNINKTVTFANTLNPQTDFEATGTTWILSNFNAAGDYSHSEGYDTFATGEGSHAQGYKTRAKGFYSHAGGYQTETRRAYSTALGRQNYSEENYTYYYSSSETKTYVYYYFNTQYQIFTGTPTQNTSTGIFTYPELTTVTGADIVEGTQIYVDDATYYVATTQESTSSQWSRWTVTVHRMKSYCEDIGTYALMVGNGGIKNNSSFSNALALNWDGNAYLMGDVYVASTGKGQNGTKLAKEPFVINFNTQDGTNFTADQTFATALAAYEAGQPLKGKIYDAIELQFLFAQDDPIGTDILTFGLNVGDESLVLTWFADNTISVEMAQLVTINNLPEESTAITSAEIDSICV